MPKTSCRINLRLYLDKSNKRTFSKFSIDECPIFQDLKDFKQCLTDTYSAEQFKGKLTIHNTTVGYIGYSNVKHVIATNAELKKGYDSGKVHKDGRPLFFMVEREPDKQPKRKLAIESSSDEEQSAKDLDKKPAKKKPMKESERIDNIVTRLQRENGAKWEVADYRLWAVALDRNLHSSYTEPPKYPHFQKKAKRTQGSKTVSAEVAAPTRESTRATKNELLDQMSKLQELMKGACSERQKKAFEAEIDGILDELKELRGR